MAENVYNLEDEKHKMLVLQRKEQEEKLIAQVKEQDHVSGQALFNKLAGKAKDDATNKNE